MRLNNLTELADLLRGLSNNELTDGMGFDMRHECGTTCCIGGWVHHINPETEHLGLVRAVATLLPFTVETFDKTWYELDELCYPARGNAYAWEATPQQAARAVEILRDTGKCDWGRAMQEVTA